MIKNYEIRNKNGIELLYIYLDYNTEFAKFNSKKNNRKLKSEVKKYIKKNNIDFKGTTVLIMIGSIMVGTIIFNKPLQRNVDFRNNNNIVAILDDYNYGDELLIDNVLDNNIEVLDVIETKDSINKINDNIKKEENKKETNNHHFDSFKSEVVIDEITIKKNEVKLDNENVSKSDNNKYVMLYRNNGEIKNIELEEYVVGVVSAEMPASFNKEALKAQSVLARTYALKSLKEGKKLTDDSNTQNYKSLEELKNMWGISFDTYYNKIVNAVKSTKGEYLIYNGDYIDSVYHSTSNGKTENSINVWGNSFPYLVSVDSEYDKTNKNFLVNTFFSYEDISNKLGKVVSIDTIFNIFRNESGRVSNIEIDGISYNGVEFRNVLGLRSTDFNIEKNSDGVNIITRGYGHGVGMSQYGANGMANNGYSYKDILLHYYKGVSILKD